MKNFMIAVSALVSTEGLDAVLKFIGLIIICIACSFVFSVIKDFLTIKKSNKNRKYRQIANLSAITQSVLLTLAYPLVIVMYGYSWLHYREYIVHSQAEFRQYFLDCVCNLNNRHYKNTPDKVKYMLLVCYLTLFMVATLI